MSQNLSQSDNRFLNAIIAMTRTKELINGAEPKLKYYNKNDKEVSIALKEIEAGLISLEDIKETIKNEKNSKAHPFDISNNEEDNFIDKIDFLFSDESEEMDEDGEEAEYDDDSDDILIEDDIEKEID